MEAVLEGNMISELMEQEGPIVEVVLLKPDGTVDQVKLDMTPKANAVSITLEGPATFIGQYADINVFILKNREPSADAPVNKTLLPAPFNKEEAKGPILLVRMNEESVPEDFTKQEFAEYVEKVLKNPPEPIEDDNEEEGGEEGEDEEEEEGEDEEEEEEISEKDQKLMEEALQKFITEKGRMPTAEELQSVLASAYLDDDSDGEAYEEGDDAADESENENKQQESNAVTDATDDETSKNVKEASKLNNESTPEEVNPENKTSSSNNKRSATELNNPDAKKVAVE